MALDALDQRLLAALQENGRLTATELAERIGLTTSPCLRRIRQLEDAGVIKGYSTVVDQTKVGLPVSVFVSIKLERQREETLQHFEVAIRRWPEVVECYLMTGTRDYLLRVVARGPRRLRTFSEGETDTARRRCQHRIQFRPGPGQAFDGPAHQRERSFQRMNMG